VARITSCVYQRRDIRYSRVNVNHAVRKSAGLTGATGVAVNENAKTRFEREEGQKETEELTTSRDA